MGQYVCRILGFKQGFPRMTFLFLTLTCWQGIQQCVIYNYSQMVMLGIIKLKWPTKIMKHYFQHAICHCNVMCFGVINARATYLRMEMACLSSQRAKKHISLLSVSSLSSCKQVLKPTKVHFRGQNRKDFGYIVRFRGIEDDPSKSEATIEILFLKLEEQV